MSSKFLLALTYIGGRIKGLKFNKTMTFKECCLYHFLKKCVYSLKNVQKFNLVKK
jgi:hypothetical protein